MDANLLKLWKEFGNEGAPSIRSAFEKEPYEEKDAVIRYLKAGKIKLATFEYFKDAITGEEIAPLQILTDGEFTWDSSFAYYVEKYNLRLPKVFGEKAVAAYKKV